MGRTYVFKCKQCNHSVESSGHLDHGMWAVVKPYTCERCHNVVDVLIGEYGNIIPESELKGTQKDEFYCCSKCNSRNIIEWNPKTHPCPKCGNKMTAIGEAAFWD